MSKALLLTAIAIGFTLATSHSLQAQSPGSKQPVRGRALTKQLAELNSRVAKLEAQSETASLAIAQISSRLAELNQQLEALAVAQRTSPESIQRLDEIGIKVAALEHDLELQRTQLANLEQPYVAPASESRTGLTLGSGDYTARIAGYAQLRWELALPNAFDSIRRSSFSVVRARAGLSGRIGRIFDKKLSYKLVADFSDSVSLRDIYLDLDVIDGLSLRIGQAKIQHIRSSNSSSTKLLFTDRSRAVSNHRYRRDVGLWARGKFYDGRVGYVAGVSNGAGRNRKNDNIDFALQARGYGTVFGDGFGVGYGDRKRTKRPSMVVGASIIHDLVQLSENVGGISVGERDVDGDGIIDNVRVVSAALDATFRYRGFEFAAEGLFRREGWGTILDHSDNANVSERVGANSRGNRNYLGAVAEASYFVWPDTVAVGGRVGYSQQTFLGVGGARTRATPGDEVFEFAMVGQLYGESGRLLGIQYSFDNFNNSSGPEEALDIEHRIVVETQLKF